MQSMRGETITENVYVRVTVKGSLGTENMANLCIDANMETKFHADTPDGHNFPKLNIQCFSPYNLLS